MTDLKRLSVSLTKHNAHKVSTLLKKYPVEQVISRLAEVQAEKAQAYKNFSVSTDGCLPEVWGKVKALGAGAIDALVLVAIIFSHHRLIYAMTNAASRSKFTGRIDRDVHLDGKEYTNFSRVIHQLGFATSLDSASFGFNLQPLFKIPSIGPLVAELLELKLKAAQWDREGSVTDEAIRVHFHDVFGLSADEFRVWVSDAPSPPKLNNPLLPKDKDFFQAGIDDGGSQPFRFISGHVERSVNAVLRASTAEATAAQLHNDIQNRLYKYFCKKLGAACVGTELNTGYGTVVDMATLYRGKLTFYEIKTSASVRANIRQSISQLLEYACWPDEMRASELVIVSHLPVTAAAARYLEYLRVTFNLPISYRHFDLNLGQLV